MARRTQSFDLMPWTGGVNNTLDAARIDPGQLVQGDHMIYGERGSRKKREGITFNWDSGSSGTASVWLSEFWYGTTSRTQALAGLHSDKKFHSYDLSNGTKSSDLFAGTAWGSSITKASFEVLNNLLIIAVDGTSNVMKKWSGSGNIADLGGTPPVASIVRKHLGRLFCNDKTNVDRLHYSTTANPEEWNGAGDSGAIDIGVGDGDSEGITAIFPTFKGVLFVAKRTKLYKIYGDTPESFQVILVSNAIGCVSHNSVAQIDQDDIIFISERGIHSLATTDQYGDFSASFLSKDLQKSFNSDFTKSRLKFSWGAYLGSINSVAFAITDETADSTGKNNAVWLYNFEQKGWYRWPAISCESLIVVTESDQKRFYLGQSISRVAKASNGLNYDVSSAGTNTAITMSLKTGQIAVDGNPGIEKAYKRLKLYYRPVGTHTVTVNYKIDNGSTGSGAFSDTGSADLLGVNFYVGTSILGVTAVLGAYAIEIDGYGKTIQITISQSGTDEEIDIQGLGIDFESLGDRQETVS